MSDRDSDARRAIGLYAVLARDAMDFVEMSVESSDDALDYLYLMLTLRNPKHDADTRKLNEIGSDIVARIIKARGRKLPELEGP
jgi:hypothetical protein